MILFVCTCASAAFNENTCILVDIFHSSVAGRELPPVPRNLERDENGNFPVLPLAFCAPAETLIVPQLDFSLFPCQELTGDLPSYCH
jgi:hypothetical protein